MIIDSQQCVMRSSIFGKSIFAYKQTTLQTVKTVGKLVATERLIYLFRLKYILNNISCRR